MCTKNFELIKVEHFCLVELSRCWPLMYSFDAADEI